MSSDHTGSRVAAVTACYIVPIPLEILATSLRIYARQRQGQGQGRPGRNRFATDDFLILFATVGGRPTSACFRLPCRLHQSKPDLAFLDLRSRRMLCWPGLRFDWLSNPPQLTTHLLWAGPPHGFGKHIDQVSAHDFETFEVVLRSITAAVPSCCTKLTHTDTSRAIISSAIFTT